MNWLRRLLGGGRGDSPTPSQPGADPRQQFLETVRRNRDHLPGGAVESALAAGPWSLAHLEALLDALGPPEREDPWIPAFNVRRWPWGSRAFVAELARHRHEPDFARLLGRFAGEVLPHIYCIHPDATELVLPLLAEHPDIMASLITAIAAAEEERRRRLAARDLTRTDRYLRERLTRQLWPLAYHPRARVTGDRSVYVRALGAIAYPGQAELVARLEAEARQQPYITHEIVPADYFAGTELPSRVDIPEAYLAKLRSLAESDLPFLRQFEPGALEAQFRQVEHLAEAASSRQWLAVHAACGGRPEQAARVLGVLAAAPKQPPAGDWGQAWEQAAAPLGREAARDMCHQLWAISVAEGLLVDELALVTTRGAVWGAAAVADAGTCDRLAGHGLTWSRWPNVGITLTLAAIRSLERIGTPAATSALQQAAQRIKHKAALQALEKSLENLAAVRGMDSATLQDLAVDACGLDAGGSRTWTMGEFSAELRLTQWGQTDVTYRRIGTGRETSTAPQEVRKAFPEELTEVRQAAQRLQKVYAAQRLRLEQAMVDERAWDWDAWQQSFSNPVLRNLAGRLIWQIVRAGGTAATGLPDAAGRWVNAAGGPADAGPGTRLRVAHPVHLAPEERARWQRHVVQHGVIQPFKQAFRETYVLTPADQATPFHTLRFAGRLVPHRTLYALLRERGWSGMGYLGENEQPAHRDFAAQGCRAVLERQMTTHEGEGLVTLDNVSFVPLRQVRGRRQADSGDRLPLPEVPPVAFSEAMRDVDLVAGVAGLGTDADWQDWEQRRQDGSSLWRHQQEAYEGLLTATGELRAVLLGALLPQLSLPAPVTVTGQWAVVQGTLHTYRVHLGSGNVHLDPSGRYVGILPPAAAPAEIVLPDEGDHKTGEVLHKIRLLAQDDRITDPAILRQLK